MAKITATYLQSYTQDEGAAHVHVTLVHVDSNGQETTEYVAPPVLEEELEALAKKRRATTWGQDDIVALLNGRGYAPAVARHPRVAETAKERALEAEGRTLAAAVGTPDPKPRPAKKAAKKVAKKSAKKATRRSR